MIWGILFLLQPGHVPLRGFLWKLVHNHQRFIFICQKTSKSHPHLEWSSCGSVCRWQFSHSGASGSTKASLVLCLMDSHTSAFTLIFTANYCCQYRANKPSVRICLGFWVSLTFHSNILKLQCIPWGFIRLVPHSIREINAKGIKNIGFYCSLKKIALWSHCSIEYNFVFQIFLFLSVYECIDKIMRHRKKILLNSFPVFSYASWKNHYQQE